jgi:hypothetical protein
MSIIIKLYISIYRWLTSEPSKMQMLKMQSAVKRLCPNIKNIVLLATTDSKIILDKKIFSDVKIDSSLMQESGDQTDLLVLDSRPKDAISFLEKEKDTLERLKIKIIILPISFTETANNHPLSSKAIEVLKSSGYSLFNYYNIQRKNGRIEPAYGLFISAILRENMLNRYHQ